MTLSTMPKLQKLYYTTGEVASLCGVSFRTVIRWVQKGYLKANRLPGRGDHRVARADLEEFLMKNRISLAGETNATEKRALIVEDDKIMARSIDRALKNLGFETRVAKDGFEAGYWLKQEHPTVMTLDLKMKGIDGHGVLDFLAQNEGEKKIKIVVISGDSLENIQTAVNKGAHAFLRKPFRHADLKKVLDTLDV